MKIKTEAKFVLCPLILCSSFVLLPSYFIILLPSYFKETGFLHRQTTDLDKVQQPCSEGLQEIF